VLPTAFEFYFTNPLFHKYCYFSPL